MSQLHSSRSTLFRYFTKSISLVLAEAYIIPCQTSMKLLTVKNFIIAVWQRALNTSLLSGVEACSEPNRTSKKELFAKLVNG